MAASKQARFVAEYIKDLNGLQAAIRAGYSPKTAAMQASRLLTKDNVKSLIQDAQARSMQRAEITADDIKRVLKGQALANPNDLTGWRIGACRYCWGEGNRYQRTAGEIERERETFETELNRLLDSGDPKEAEKAAKMGEFDLRGGIGWNPNREPNPECAECFGEGVGRPFVRDTRTLSPGALALYAGLEITKDGVKIKTNSQESARLALAKHFGLLVDRAVITISAEDNQRLEALSDALAEAGVPEDVYDATVKAYLAKLTALAKPSV
jgi:hypothetical protein